MTRFILNKIIAGIAIASIIMVNNFDALAANTNMQQDNQILFNSNKKMDFTAVKDGDLFSNLKELVPGDEVSNIVTVSNDSKYDVTIYLKTFSDYERVDENGVLIRHRDDFDSNLVSEENKTFKEDLLTLIKMNIKVDGEYIYGDDDWSFDATCTGDISDNTYGINLGSFPKGSSKNIEVSIKLPKKEMDNSYEDKFSAIDWIFYAQGDDILENNGGSSTGGGSSDSESYYAIPSKPNNVQVTDSRLNNIASDIISNFTIRIDDNTVPLNSMVDDMLKNLAKTGDRVIYLKQSLTILVLLIVGLCSIEYVQRKNRRVHEG